MDQYCCNIKTNGAFAVISRFHDVKKCVVLWKIKQDFDIDFSSSLVRGIKVSIHGDTSLHDVLLQHGSNGACSM